MSKFMNVLPQEALNFLSQQLLDSPDLSDELNSKYYYNSLGIANLPASLIYVPVIENLVKSVCDYPIKFANTYARIYRKGSYLGIHTDRVGLDVSVSLCIKKQSLCSWPLYLSKIEWFGPWREDIDVQLWKDNAIGVDLKPGEATIMEGTRYPHWREPLDCDEDQHDLYVFFHWEKLSGK